MQELDILQGSISAIVYQNYENGYSVLRLACDNGATVTVVGIIPLPILGERLMVTGKWSTHHSYGKQFEAEFLERLMPQTASQILTYLSGRAVKGIGPKTAAAIVNRFGDQALIIMEREPERLSEISGISDAKAMAIGEAYRLQVGMRLVLEFFTRHLLPAELAVKCYKIYGDSIIEQLYNDPYLLMDDGLNAPFGAVDRFAIDMGIVADDFRRVDAGIRFELAYNASAGHSFLPEDKLRDATAQLLSIKPETAAAGIDRLAGRKKIIRDKLANIHICYLPNLYEAETYCVQRLLQCASTQYGDPDRFNRNIESLERKNNIRYAECQKAAIRQAATTSLLSITGGPGTGKTTIIKAILALYEDIGLKCTLAAPTGRAAKRLTEVTGQEACTIHRLLEAGIDPHSGELIFNRNSDNPIKTDAVIIDEMSMVDVLLFYQLLQAIPLSSRIILVGDPDQLPPVGPGHPFRDILRSNALPCVRLTEIFRQAQESMIVMNAHSVNRGEPADLSNRNKDFFFLPARTEEEVNDIILGLCTERLPRRMGIQPEQIQVLSPTKKGIAGTVSLNQRLQAELNPQVPNRMEKQYGHFIFRVGDRIMQIRNNYDIIWKKSDGSQVGTGIFNGDVGRILDIDHQMEQMRVIFDGKEAIYDFNQLNELEPAYAITVHKSQGSEYRAVVLSAFNGSPYLLCRNVLYTAITRAKELFIIVGSEETVNTMIQNGKIGRRYTGLKLRLQESANGT